MKYTKNMLFFLSLITLPTSLLSSFFDEYNDDLGQKTPANSLINHILSGLRKRDFGDHSTKDFSTIVQNVNNEDQNNNVNNENQELPVGQATIFEHLFNLGARYNKHITFIMLSFGVVLALIFPQKTKSILDETKSKIASFFEKIKTMLSLTFQKSKN